MKKIHHIGFLVLPQTQLLDIAGPTDVFTTANQLMSTLPILIDMEYKVHLISSTSNKNITTSSGLTLLCNYSITDLDITLDTLLITGSQADITNTYDPAVLHWTKGIYPTLKRIGSICIGAFLLAKTGLLNNRAATTHWQYAALFKQQYPSVKLCYGQLYAKDCNIYTSGGITSGIDLALALVEEDFDRTLAAQVSRYLVVNLKRTHTQFLYANLVPSDIELTPLVQQIKQFVYDNIANINLTNTDLAFAVNMSERNFARVFKKEAGMSPGQFYDCLRIEYAKRLLESTTFSIQEIAIQAGFATDNALRKTFQKLVEVSPTHYRASFQTTGIQNL
ncbi:MAG: DJ-1/PfpI family protein [Flavobacteriaceae bacterium]|jgi:transcriptional regulator GlxA family with amidase domain|nr:DJ-1/PfpI family protein [Flavobacteriaceae bacterium]